MFEDFIDFLSAEKLGFNDGTDTIVLNSVSNFGNAIEPLTDYPLILCFLDNDAAGRAALARLQREFGDRVMDKSALYPNHKDLNDYLVSTINRLIARAFVEKRKKKPLNPDSNYDYKS